MPISVLSHDRASNIGVGRIMYYDETYSAWRHFAMAQGISLSKSTSKAELKETHGNVARVIRKAQTAQSVSIKATIMESINPDVMELIWGDGNAAQSFGAAAGLAVATPEIIRLPEIKGIPVIHAASCAPKFEAMTSGVATDSGAAGAFTATPHQYICMAHYDDGNTWGVPTTGNITPTGSEGLLFTIVAPANEVPNHYSIWIDDGAGGSIKFLGNTTTLLTIYTAYPGSEAATYVTPVNNTFTVTNLASSVVYYNGVDFFFDEDTMSIGRMAGGSIDSGQPVLVTYYNSLPAYTKTTIGPGKMEPRTAKIRIHQLAGTDISSAIVETGLIWEFEKVDMVSEDVEWGLSEEEFFNGVAVELDCMINTSTNIFGSIYGYDPIVENWQALGI